MPQAPTSPLLATRTYAETGSALGIAGFKPGRAVRYYQGGQESIDPEKRAWMIEALRTKGQHTLDGVVNALFVFFEGETYVWPMTSRGWKAFDSFLHTQAWHGAVFAKVDAKIAKKMGHGPGQLGLSVGGSTSMARDKDGNVTLRLDDYADLFNEGDGTYDNPGRPKGFKSEYHDHDSNWRSDTVKAACILCPDKKPTCMNVGCSFSSRNAVPDTIVWVPDNNGVFHVAHRESSPYRSHGTILHTELAPACVNPVFDKLEGKFSFDQAAFEAAAEEGALPSLNSRLNADYCSACAGCRHKDRVGYRKIERADICQQPLDDLVKDVLGWVEETVGLVRFKNFLVAMEDTYRLRGEGRKAYRLVGWNWRKNLFILAHQTWTSGYHNGYRQVEVAPEDIAPVFPKTTDADHLMNLRRRRTHRFDIDHGSNHIAIKDEMMAAMALLLGLFHDPQLSPGLPPFGDRMMLKNINSLIDTVNRRDLRLFGFKLNVGRGSNDKSFNLQDWESAQSVFTYHLRARYDETKKKGGPMPIQPVPGEDTMVQRQRIINLPRVDNGFRKNLLNRSVEDLVYPMFADDDLKQIFEYRMFHGGDVCDPNGSENYLIFKARLDQTRQPMEEIAETLGHMTFLCDLPGVSGCYFGDEDMGVVRMAHELNVYDEKGAIIPGALVIIPPIASEHDAKGMYDGQIWGYIDPVEPGKPIPSRLEARFKFTVTKSVDSNKRDCASIIFVEPAEPGRP